MKRQMLCFILALGAIATSYAQQDTTTYEYCQVEVIGKIKGSKAKIRVDFGQFQSIFSSAYRDKITGKVASFSSPMDAVNYMVGIEGSSFVQVFTYQIDTGFGLYEQLYYLLRKPKKSNR